MVDTILFGTVAAAGLIGWLMCWSNARVHWAWKVVAPLALFALSVYLLFLLAGIRMELWSDVKMDRWVLAAALAPVMAWPMRAPKPAEPQQRELTT